MEIKGPRHNRRQQTDELTNEGREKWWPTMLAHKTWERKDWQATDNEDKEGGGGRKGR